jgi:hypothetical protein
MSAPAVIMPRKRSDFRSASIVAVLLKRFFVNLYVALDKTQRERATKVIQRYGHLPSNRDEDSGEQNRAIHSKDSGQESRQFWSVIVRNRRHRG